MQRPGPLRAAREKPFQCIEGAKREAPAPGTKITFPCVTQRN